jgi:RNA recognition motif-containing protein
MNMYVSNLSFHTTEEDLNKLFSAFGEVSSSKIIMDRESGRSRGFGFVEMPSAEDSKLAMAGLNNKDIEGRTLSVTVAKEREERGGGGRNSFSGGGDRNSGGDRNKRW